MACVTPTRLEVILGESNTEKLKLPDGIPELLVDLLDKITTTFRLKNNIRLQYMDKDFGNDFFDLNSTTELQDLGTIKVIHQQTNPPFSSPTDTTSSQSLSLESEDSIVSFEANNNFVILSLYLYANSNGQQTFKFLSF